MRTRRRGIQRRNTVAVKAPVFGIQIEPATAYVKTEYASKTFYFFLKHCVEEFNKNPEKHVIKNHEITET
jgi:YHS domain-containing protein